MLNSSNKIIKHKTGLLNLAEELGNVSKACQVMGYSRDTFYRYKKAVDEGGVDALFERTRRKPNMANRVDDATEQAVIKSAIEFPAYGQAGHPLYKVIDTAAAVEVNADNVLTLNGGYWIVNGTANWPTADGTHNSENTSILKAAVITSDLVPVLAV